MLEKLLRTAGPVLAVLVCACGPARADDARDQANWQAARSNAVQNGKCLIAINKVMHTWIERADPRTGLLFDRCDGERKYEIRNAASDLYPHLVITAYMTDRAAYDGFMLQSLRNEVRYSTVVNSVSANVNLDTGELNGIDLFGSAEYAKDGIVSITEIAGRTPWFYRMCDLIPDIMRNAKVPTRFGPVPGPDSEINGDMLQILVRLANMTGDRRYERWMHRIADAYVEDAMPQNHGMVPMLWDFRDSGVKVSTRTKLADHGDEVIVGLPLVYAYESYRQTDRAPRYRAALQMLFDRILESARSDGMLHREINSETLKRIKRGPIDNWGYVYGAMYAYYQVTGEAKYRDAVRKVMSGLMAYTNETWEIWIPDGVADSTEGALYLLAHETVPEAEQYVESQIQRLAAFQREDGNVMRYYLDGNFNRTMLLYALYKSKGCRADNWRPGLQVGAVVDGPLFYVNVSDSAGTSTEPVKIHFDYARHRREMNFDKDYVRLNSYPEWHTVDENTLYKVRDNAGHEMIRLGSELITGIALAPGDWVIESMGPPPYGPSNVPAPPPDKVAAQL